MKTIKDFLCESLATSKPRSINENDCAVNWCADPSFSNDPDVFSDEMEGYLDELEGGISPQVIKRAFRATADKVGTYTNIALAVIADIRGMVDEIRDNGSSISADVIKMFASYANPKSERMDAVIDSGGFDGADVADVFNNWNKFVKAATGNEWVDVRALQKDLGIRV